MDSDPLELLKRQAATLTEDFLSKVTEEWRIMYKFDENLKKKYAENILLHMKSLFDDLYEGELQKKATLISGIEECLKEHSQLQQDLHLRIERSTRDDDPLQIILQTLNKDLERYRVMREQRLKQLEDLRQKETELCDLLDIEPLEISSSLPSENDLHELGQHIFVLRKTKIERTDILRMSQERLVGMISQLELVPSNAFEKRLCEDDLSSFRLSAENMKKVEETVAKYETLVAEATERVNLLESKLEKLWDRIRLPDEERLAFNATYFGIGSSAVNALANEIDRCEILKRANMKSVIETVRKEIANLWDIMTYTTEARMEFSAYFTDVYNEDVLDLHELEQSKLEQFYEKHREIFSMAAKREHLVEKMEAFAVSARDPNRYKNRGGQLLKEEKERKATEAQLHKIDAQLKKLLPEFQQENGRPFLWRGEDLLSAISVDKSCAKSHRQKTPRAKENRPATKRKIGHVDETFTLGTKQMTPSSSVDSGINMKQLSSDSLLSSYSQFQEHIEAGSSPAKRARTPAIRTPVSRTPVLRTPGSKTPRRFV